MVPAINRHGMQNCFIREFGAGICKNLSSLRGTRAAHGYHLMQTLLHFCSIPAKQISAHTP